MHRLLLLLGGDIETNSGPTYVADKAILGIFHQGDLRFDEIAGDVDVLVTHYMHCVGLKYG